jgi:hypothetical protein
MKSALVVAALVAAVAAAAQCPPIANELLRALYRDRDGALWCGRRPS